VRELDGTTGGGTACYRGAWRYQFVLTPPRSAPAHTPITPFQLQPSQAQK